MCTNIKLNKRKVSLLIFFPFLTFILSGCSGQIGKKNDSNKDIYKIAMVTDLSGVNDQSFNQSAWEGLESLKEELKGKVDVSYTEPKQSSDYTLILDRLSDKDYNLIYGISFSLSDAIYETALLNLDKNYVLVDSSYGKDTPNNVTCITFCAQESAFLVGYIAGKVTKTNKLGFVGGQRSEIIDQFEYGYKAGVSYAAKELNKNIEALTQYAGSFSDVAKGKAIASNMYSKGCDDIFQAAGGTGYGVIEAAKENRKFVIGVDRDQSDIAPGNVLTSALKNVNKAVNLVSKKMINREDILGKTLVFGVKDDCVGIPNDYKLMGKGVYDSAIKLKENIKDGNITVNGKVLTIPINKESYSNYLKELGKF